MTSSSLGLLVLLLLLAGEQMVEGRRHLQHSPDSSRPSKLFVFGDSYADTGNNRKSIGGSWKTPYGITYPGKPSGRFSDGLLLTDFFAKSLGLMSPVPYQWRKLGQPFLKYGMNFAYGGTGVFDTTAPYPNMTAQISLFDNVIKSNSYSAADVNLSVTLIALSGNDYSAYLARNGTIEGLPAFIGSVVNQLGVNLRQLYELGTRKVVVMALQPIGCLPTSTATNAFQKCNETLNQLVGLHNQLLHKVVSDLNNQTANSSTFVVADLFGSFITALNNTGHENSKFVNPLKPCCVGVSSGFNCGSVDGNGTKMYTVCEAPKSAFFWDMFHPTQAGWRAVYPSLSTVLQQI